MSEITFVFLTKVLADQLGYDTIRAALVRSFMFPPTKRRSGVRVAEGARLESVYTETYRGFESLPDRHQFKQKSLDNHFRFRGFFVFKIHSY